MRRTTDLADGHVYLIQPGDIVRWDQPACCPTCGQNLTAVRLYRVLACIITDNQDGCSCCGNQTYDTRLMLLRGDVVYYIRATAVPMGARTDEERFQVHSLHKCEHKSGNCLCPIDYALVDISEAITGKYKHRHIQEGP
jgi:hypothetical protein